MASHAVWFALYHCTYVFDFLFSFCWIVLLFLPFVIHPPISALFLAYYIWLFFLNRCCIFAINLLTHSTLNSLIVTHVVLFHLVFWTCFICSIIVLMTRIEMSELMMYKAAALKDAGLPFTKEAAMAKLACSETATYVAHQSIQVGECWTWWGFFNTVLYKLDHDFYFLFRINCGLKLSILFCQSVRPFVRYDGWHCSIVRFQNMLRIRCWVVWATSQICPSREITGMPGLLRFTR